MFILRSIPEQEGHRTVRKGHYFGCLLMSLLTAQNKVLKEWITDLNSTRRKVRMDEWMERWWLKKWAWGLPDIFGWSSLLFLLRYFCVLNCFNCNCNCGSTRYFNVVYLIYLSAICSEVCVNLLPQCLLFVSQSVCAMFSIIQIQLKASHSKKIYKLI